MEEKKVSPAVGTEVAQRAGKTADSVGTTVNE